MTSSDRFVDVVARLPEAHEIRVGVENDNAQARLEKQLLEHHPERVGLPRPRLATEKRVTVEPSGVEAEGCTGCEPELADLGEPHVPDERARAMRGLPRRPPGAGGRRERESCRRRG